MKKDHLCYSCLYMDNRPESGTQGNLIYCQKKCIVVSPKKACDVYVRATARNREDMKNSLYGTIEGEDLE
jgi:hypothetical protein